MIVRQLRPPEVEMIDAVGEPDLTLGRFWVWPEDNPGAAVLVEAHGVFGALDMGPDLWPDGDPWCAREESEGHPATPTEEP